MWLVTTVSTENGEALSYTLRMVNVTFLLPLMLRVEISLLCLKNGFTFRTLNFLFYHTPTTKTSVSYSANGDSVSAMNGDHFFCQKQLSLPSSDHEQFLHDVVARNYIFGLIWRCYGPIRDILDCWGTIFILFIILLYLIER